MRPEEDRRSVFQLLNAALTQLGLLVQTEIRLARAEVAEKAIAAGVGLGLIGLALVFAVPTVVILLLAIANWLARLGFSTAGADAIVGIVALAVTIVLFLVGVSRLRPTSLKPRRTLSQVQRDVSVMKDPAI